MCVVSVAVAILRLLVRVHSFMMSLARPVPLVGCQPPP